MGIAIKTRPKIGKSSKWKRMRCYSTEYGSFFLSCYCCCRRHCRWKQKFDKRAHQQGIEQSFAYIHTYKSLLVICKEREQNKSFVQHLLLYALKIILPEVPKINTVGFLGHVVFFPLFKYTFAVYTSIYIDFIYLFYARKGTTFRIYCLKNKFLENMIGPCVDLISDFRNSFPYLAFFSQEFCPKNYLNIFAYIYLYVRMQDYSPCRQFF